MKLALKILAALLVVVAVVTVYGTTLPVRHQAASMARFSQTPETLWAVITDIPGMAAWRTGVTGAEPLPDRDGHKVWLLHGEKGDLPLVVAELEPPRWMKTVIPADADLPFGGSWSWQISPGDGATVVTIIEEGEVYNPIFRALSKLVFGYNESLNLTLADLGRRFGEPVEPQAIPQAVLPD